MVFRRIIMKNIKKILCLLLVTVLIMGFSGSFNKELLTTDVAADSAISLIKSVEATSLVVNEITTDTDFVVKTNEKMDIETFKKSFEILPKADYSIKRNSSTKFTISLNNQLTAGTVYNINSINNEQIVYRWAFQTTDVFKITEEYPYDDTNSSELDSGIEVTFSYIDVENFEDYFSISPSIKGSFSHIGKTWVFAPDELLADNQTYTVTIDKNISNSAGTILGEDYSFSFTMTNNQTSAYIINECDDYADAFLPDEKPTAMYYIDKIENLDASVNVYKFPDSSNFISANDLYFSEQNFGKIGTLISSLTKVNDFTTELIKSGNGYNSYGFINYPTSYDKGYYLSVINFDGLTTYHVFQVSDLAVYAVCACEDYTVWVNDTVTGKALSGVKVSLDKGGTAKTDKNGLVNFESKKIEASSRYLTIWDNKTTPFIAYVYSDTEIDYVSANRDYYSQLYLNSSLYRSGDTVKLWGIAFPRTKNAVSPDVSLYLSWLDKTVDIKVDKNGSFNAEYDVDIPNGDDGYIELRINDQEVSSRYFNVENYELPLYYMKSSQQKQAVFSGESNTITIDAFYNDGTPASQLPIDIIDYTEDEKTINTNTDKNGTVKYKYTAAEVVGCTSWNANNNSLNALSGEHDDSNFCYTDISILTFPRNVMVEGSYSNGKLIFNSSKIILDKLNSPDSKTTSEDYYGDSFNDMIRGSNIDINFTVNVHKEYYTKEENGSYYDAINKKVVKSYSYKTNDDIVNTIDGKTLNGSSTLKLNYTNDDSANYYFEIVYNDTLGRQTYAKIYINDDYYLNEHPNVYSTNIDNTDNIQIGDTINASLTNNGKKITSGRVLASFTCSEIIETKLYDSTEFSFNFKKEYSPDIILCTAYFDGKYIYSTGDQYLYCNKDSLELDIDAVADKKSYKPGDEVNLNITVADKNGNGVSSVVNINVVDSALLSMAANEPEALQNILSNRAYLSHPQQYVSHRNYQENDEGGEGGGGDESETRVDFEDTPLFKTITTDKKGNATLKFNLPDSITTWTIITQAVTEDGFAGDIKSSVICTKDLYANTITTSKNTCNDDFVVVAKGISASLDSSKTCKFDVSLYSVNESGSRKKISSKSSTASLNKYESINLGKLDVGSYVYVLKSSCSGYTDTLEKTFDVANSILSTTMTTTSNISKNTSLNLDTEFPVTVILQDESKSLFTKAINKLYESSGSRIDQQLGYIKAAAYLKGETDCDYSRLSIYQKDSEYENDYGVSLFPDGDVSIELSAKVAAVCPETFTKNIFYYDFDSIIDSKDYASTEKFIAYFGLASLGNNVLTDLNALYKSYSTLTVEQQLYLGLSFAYIGDFATASKIYELLKVNLITSDSMTYWNSDNSYVQESYTGLISLLASRISASETKPLLNYLINHDSKTVLLNLELIAYIDNFIPTVQGNDTVTLTHADGTKEKITFAKIESYRLTLPAKEIKKATFTSSDSVIALSTFNADAKTLKSLGEVCGTIGLDTEKSLNAGDNFDINYTVETDSIDDMVLFKIALPSGIRCSGSYYIEGYRYSCNSFDDRTITVMLYNNTNYLITINCSACVKGSYTLEPAIAVLDQSSKYFTSDEKKIIIK